MLKLRQRTVEQLLATANQDANKGWTIDHRMPYGLCDRVLDVRRARSSAIVPAGCADKRACRYDPADGVG